MNPAGPNKLRKQLQKTGLESNKFACLLEQIEVAYSFCTLRHEVGVDELTIPLLGIINSSTPISYPKFSLFPHFEHNPETEISSELNVKISQLTSFSAVLAPKSARLAGFLPVPIPFRSFFC